MPEIDIRRSQQIFNPQEHERPVVIAGCGATGSHIALLLACLGVRNITVVDYDTVAEHNLSNQFFSWRNVGMAKVHALVERLDNKFGPGGGCNPINGRLPEAFSLFRVVQGENPVLFLCVDSMKARREIVEALPAGNWYIIDTRMAASHGNVLGFDADQRERYYNTLIRDEDAEVAPCGTQITVIPTVYRTASDAVWEYIKLCTDPDSLEERIDFFLKPTAIHAGRM